MEKELKIKTEDNKVIEGIIRGPFDRPMVVLVHGLCGNMNEAMHYNAARYFEQQGFSSVRFGLYGFGKENRKLHECTLKTHGEDIDTVLKFLKINNAQKIFAVGHSYGFPSILHAQEKDTITAIVSWDGSILPRDEFQKLVSINEPVKGKLLDEGYMTIMGESMVAEEGRVESERLALEFKKPIKLISIPVDGNLEGAEKLFAALPEPKELTIIKGATHCFTEEGKQEELYKETVAWFKKFL